MRTREEAELAWSLLLADSHQGLHIIYIPFSHLCPQGIGSVGIVS